MYQWVYARYNNTYAWKYSKRQYADLIIIPLKAIEEDNYLSALIESVSDSKLLHPAKGYLAILNQRHEFAL